MTPRSLPIRFFERPLFWPVLLILLAAGTYCLRLDAPTDLEGYAQPRNIGYVLDVIHHDHWLTQRDLQGRIQSKPPLHTWTASLSVKAFGMNRLGLTFPSLIAVIALTLLVYHIGRRQFGVIAGGLAGLAVVMSPLFSKQVAMVRSDAIFAFFIAAGSWAAWRAWREGKSWTAFWFLGALGTLTKGPLCVLLAGVGLVACLWEKRSSTAPVRLRGSHTLGLLVFFAVCFAWLIPALIESGRELVDMIFYGELLGQATGVSKGKIPFSHFPEPTLNLLSRFAPFSLLGFYGLWRVFRRPSADPTERAFERFLACAVLGGLLVFSCAAHFRSDLILPLWAPCALLAGREGARLLQRVGGFRFLWGLAAVTAGLAVFAFITYHPSKGPRSRVTDNSLRVLAAAEALRKTDIVPARLVHIGTPTTLQLYLGTAHTWVTPSEIRALFTDDGPPRLLALGTAADDATLPDTVLAEIATATTSRELFRWPENRDESPVVTIYELAW